MKKMCNMIMVLVLLISSAKTVVFAETLNGVDNMLNESEQSQFYSQMNFFYSDTDMLGIEQEDIENLYMGEPVYSYEYVDNTYQVINRLLYPIICDDKIVLWANKIEENGSSTILLTAELTEEMTRYYMSGDEVALVYDNEKCYVITNESSEVLSQYGYTIDSRDEYEQNNSAVGEIEYTELKKAVKLDYCPSKARASTAYLSVPMVYQGEGTNLCWAASIACIGNYINSKNYTAEEVSRYMYGDKFNRAATTEEALDVLFYRYSIDYTKTSSVPSDSKIYSNLREGYPIYSHWQSGNSNHATVIRGITTGDYILIMNPASGFMVADKSGSTYTYVSVKNSATYSLHHCALKE